MDTISFFIPIRKGSRRIKNKSFRKILNYKFGLTEIKVKQLLTLKKTFNKNIKNFKLEFIVSSDSKLVENYIKKFSWIKFHNRAPNLSTDNSLDKLIEVVPSICSGKIILWTHVTSPLFGSKEYIDFIKEFLKKKNKSAFSGIQISSFIYNQSKKKFISHSGNSKKWPRTQDLDKIFIVNSAAFIADRGVYIKYKNRLDPNPLPIIINKKKSLDIDSPVDLIYLEKILKQNDKKN